MNNNLSRLEIIPNETFIDIFQYLDARHLFRAFYNLNSRFNILLRSLNNLCLTLLKFYPNKRDNFYIFSRYIHIMILDYEANINFNNFTNLRCLKLINPTCEQLDRLNSVRLPYLEHLSIGYTHYCCDYPTARHEHNHCDKIFSNEFPSLISCYLLYPDVISMLSCTNQATQLRILRVKTIKLISYQTILSACPNLYFFRFRIPYLYEKSLIMRSHLNLRQMFIECYDYSSSCNDYNIDDYLSCVPNLEKLCVYRSSVHINPTPYLNYNWLAVSVDRHLSLFRQFKYHIDMYFTDELIKNDNENLLNHLEENFKHAHNNRYQSKLVLNLLFPERIFD